MEDTQIIELYFKRDEAALQETNDKYGAYCFRTVSEGNISAEYIRDNLSDHTPMIFSMKLGNFTYTGHFIVLTGIDEKKLVTVNDPNSPKNSSKKWDGDKLVSQMKSIWMYRL